VFVVRVLADLLATLCITNFRRSIVVFVCADRLSKRSVHLWQFLKELLMCPTTYQNAIRWLDRHNGWYTLHEFRLCVDPILKCDRTLRESARVLL